MFKITAFTLFVLLTLTSTAQAMGKKGAVQTREGYELQEIKAGLYKITLSYTGYYCTPAVMIGEFREVEGSLGNELVANFGVIYDKCNSPTLMTVKSNTIEVNVGLMGLKVWIPKTTVLMVEIVERSYSPPNSGLPIHK